MIGTPVTPGLENTGLRLACAASSQPKQMRVAQAMLPYCSIQPGFEGFMDMSSSGSPWLAADALSHNPKRSCEARHDREHCPMGIE